MSAERDNLLRESAASAAGHKQQVADTAGPPADGAPATFDYSNDREAAPAAPKKKRRTRAAGAPDASKPLPTSRALIAARYQIADARALMFWQEEFLHFRSGGWLTVPPSEVKTSIYEFLEAGGETPTRRDVGEVLEALKATAFENPRTEPPSWLDDPSRSASNLLVCTNGAFDLSTGETHPHTPKLFSLSTLPVAYEPAAEPPVEWLKFLSSLWPTDAESIATLQEIAGLLLTPVTKFQKIFLLVGPRRSGKGTILRTLGAILGKCNIVAPTLASLGQPFGLQPLIGKLAALVGDARLGGKADQAAITERLLSISGEDHINVGRKFLPDYTGRLGVRFLLSTNELPTLSDASGALASRFIVLQLEQSFLGREDLALFNRLEPELPAILLWAIEGRRRLLDRGYFQQPASAAAAVDRIESLGSPIKAFLHDACEIGPGLRIPASDLYAAWRYWCDAAGRKPGSEQIFGRDLHAALPGLRVTQPRTEEGGRRREYEGVCLARSGTRSTPLHSVQDKYASSTHNTDISDTRTPCNGNARVPARANDDDDIPF